jgi:exopolysaccharide production protein ExoZ
MWIGLAYRQGLRLPRILALALIAIGCVLMFNDFHHVVALGTGLTAWLIPAVIVTGSTLGGFILRGPAWGVLVMIGNASYALYLFQAIPVRALFYLARWTGVDIGQATSICLDGVIVVSIVLAVLIYHLLERPLTKALRGFAGFRSAKAKSAVTSG